jgi:protein subunit release factor B
MPLKKNGHMMGAKEPLFSVTKKDLRIDTFRAGGKGGSNQNKRETGVRITHPASGAVAESRQYRTQEENKRSAFRKLTESERFNVWIKTEAAKIMNLSDIQVLVDRMLAPENLKIEVRSNGQWIDG